MRILQGDNGRGICKPRFQHHELLQLANGDYILCEHGRFEIVELLLPDDKTASDGGYTFEQHFNPHWWRGRNFKLFYSRQAGHEASWKIDDPTMFAPGKIRNGYEYMKLKTSRDIQIKHIVCVINSAKGMEIKTFDFK